MHVLVTGASAGIGEAIAREYHKRGASVTLVARRVEKLRALAKDLGGKTAVIAADLSDPKHCTHIVDEAEGSFGPVDVLVNNAGIQHIERTEIADAERGEELLLVNLAVPMRLIRRVLPGMVERERGTIVNVSSMAALSPVGGMFYYNAAKGGLANASEALRGELRGRGVNVLTVYPGPVHTDMGEKGLARYESTLGAQLAPWGTTDELAHLVVRGVELGSARVIYPRSYAVSLYFPNLSRWFSLRFSPPIKD